jgi:hypothetical protein
VDWIWSWYSYWLSNWNWYWLSDWNVLNDWNFVWYLSFSKQKILKLLLWEGNFFKNKFSFTGYGADTGTLTGTGTLT